MHSGISRVVKQFAFYSSAFRSRNRETFDISFSVPRACIRKKTQNKTKTEPEGDQTDAQVNKDAAAFLGITLGLAAREKRIKVGFSRVVQDAAKD